MAYGIIIGISLILGGILMIVFPEDYYVPLIAIGCGTSLAAFLGIKQYWSRISSTPGISDTAKLLKSGWVWILLILLIISIVGWNSRRQIADYLKKIHSEKFLSVLTTSNKKHLIDTVRIDQPPFPRLFSGFLPPGNYTVEIEPSGAATGAALRVRLPNGSYELRSIENNSVSIRKGEEGIGIKTLSVAIARIYL